MPKVVTAATLLAVAAAVLDISGKLDLLTLTLTASTFLLAALKLTSPHHHQAGSHRATQILAISASLPVAAGALAFTDHQTTRWAAVLALVACAATSTPAGVVGHHLSATTAVAATSLMAASGWTARDQFTAGHTLLAAAAVTPAALVTGHLVWWLRWRSKGEHRRTRRQHLVRWNRRHGQLLLISAAAWVALTAVRWTKVETLGVLTACVGAALALTALLSRAASNSVTQKHEPRRLTVTATVVLSTLVPVTAASGLIPTEETAASPTPVAASSAITEPPPTLGDFEACTNVADYLAQRDCYSAFFIEYAATEGTQEALDLLLELYGQQTAVAFRNHCHEVLHDVAFAESVRLGGPEKLFPYYRVTCTGGFSHGILVAYTQKVGWDSIEAELPTFCRRLTNDIVTSLIASGQQVTDDSWIEWACDHMLGHEIYKNSRDDHVRGAALCNTWAYPDDRHTNCTAGFFMEHFLDTGRELNGWTRPTSIDEVFQFCHLVPIEVRRGCFHEVGANILSYSGSDWVTAYTMCLDNAPEDALSECYDSLARMVTVYSGFDPQRMKDTCVSVMVVDPIATDVCGDAIAGSLVMEIQDYENARRVCDEIVKSEKWYSRCTERVESVSQQIDNSGLAGSVTR